MDGDRTLYGVGCRGYAAIAGFGSTIKTEGNQNNELGLPRTMFRIGKETQYAVVEMGMSHAGEIERLSKCARPDVGIITCSGLDTANKPAVQSAINMAEHHGWGERKKKFTGIRVLRIK